MPKFNVSWYLKPSDGKEYDVEAPNVFLRGYTISEWGELR